MNQIWSFSQASHLPPSNKGVCMQLVAFWVGQMYKNKDDMNASPKKLEVSCSCEAQKLQKFYTKATGAHLSKDEAVTWRLRGLAVGDYENCTSATIVDFMAGKRTGYSLGIYFSGGGGHALGIWRSGESGGLLSKLSGHTYFFDPNFGCFKGNTSSFKGWLGTFISTHYATCNKMEIAKVFEPTAPRFGVKMF